MRHANVVVSVGFVRVAAPVWSLPVLPGVSVNRAADPATPQTGFIEQVSAVGSGVPGAGAHGFVVLTLARDSRRLDNRGQVSSLIRQFANDPHSETLRQGPVYVIRRRAAGPAPPAARR